jgi:hypothetical protein
VVVVAVAVVVVNVVAVVVEEGELTLSSLFSALLSRSLLLVGVRAGVGESGSGGGDCEGGSGGGPVLTTLYSCALG